MFSDEAFDLRVVIDAKHYRISKTEQLKIDEDIEHLRRQIVRFPVAELKVEIAPRAKLGGVTVKTSLLLPGSTLVASDEDVVAYPAFQRCVAKLTEQLKAYKDELSNKPVYEKQIQGTLHEVTPTQEPKLEDIEVAVATGDYAGFRIALGVYDESLAGRVGRLVERHPSALRKFGDSVPISQIVEDVMLTAFDRFDRRPHARLGQWLEELIDPAIDALANDSAERENLSFIESAKEA
jgi:ribosome-associated translation inhibitor RaiA